MIRATAIRTVVRAAVVAVLMAMVLVPAASAHPRAGDVLPPSARPMGYSLTRMASEMAMFSASMNNDDYYPRTPFQILSFDPTAVQYDNSDGVLAVSGTNDFTVWAGTGFYVPLQNADDSPPVLGTFPRTRAEARPYFFRQSQLGAQGFRIMVDGRSTPIGPRYLAGPVTTPPLPDGGGRHMITLGAFLAPMSPGKHTIRIGGGLYGDLLSSAYDFNRLTGDFSYTVTVLPPEPRKHR